MGDQYNEAPDGEGTNAGDGPASVFGISADQGPCLAALTRGIVNGDQTLLQVVTNAYDKAFPLPEPARRGRGHN